MCWVGCSTPTPPSEIPLMMLKCCTDYRWVCCDPIPASTLYLQVHKAAIVIFRFRTVGQIIITDYSINTPFPPKRAGVLGFLNASQPTTNPIPTFQRQGSRPVNFMWSFIFGWKSVQHCVESSLWYVRTMSVNFNINYDQRWSQQILLKNKIQTYTKAVLLNHHFWTSVYVCWWLCMETQRPLPVFWGFGWIRTSSGRVTVKSDVDAQSVFK